MSPSEKLLEDAERTLLDKESWSHLKNQHQLVNYMYQMDNNVDNDIFYAVQQRQDFHYITDLILN